MRLNVTSEIGKLKSVLVHLPGREIDVMVPPMMTQLLFDDILYGQVAREEHRRFQQLLRFVAQNVYDIQDLLEEILEDDDVKLEVLRDLGAGVAVDDFGTGYSSLSYLQRFPATAIKIARDFVAVDDSDADSWELASAVVSMGRALRLTVIAEGVEEAFQLERLRKLGCDRAQGYYLARPLAADELERLFAQRGVALLPSPAEAIGLR